MTTPEEAVQRWCEQHLAWCNETIFGEGESSAPKGWSPYGPYCGCDTCQVREVLMAAIETGKFRWVTDTEESE